MSFPLENARLCLDCDTVFDEAQCPGCGSESYFPLSRWVRPANGSAGAAPPRLVSKKARNTSLMLGGAGIGYALWKLLKTPNNKPSGKKDSNPPK